MLLRMWLFVSVVLAALVAGMFFAPWVALTRSMKTFTPETFLAVVKRLNLNMAPAMTVLMPLALLSMVPVLWLSYRALPGVFYSTTAGFTLFVVALLVTMLVEMPIVKQIDTWTVATLPESWEQLRDRWGAFHLVRIVAGGLGFGLLLAGALL